MNFNSIPGLEAISYQSYSTLGDQLTKIFQEAIDYREGLDYSKAGAGETGHKEYRWYMVSNFVRNTTAPKFIKALETTCNLEVKELKLFDDPDVGISMFFAINLDISNMEPYMEKIVTRETSQYSQAEAVLNKDSFDHAVEDLSHLGDCIDLDNARLSSNRFGRNGQKIFISTIYFDTIGAFLSADYVSEKYAEPMTAQEIAAIMMHEVGHAMTVIEHACDMYCTCSRLRNFAVNLKRNKDKINSEDSAKFISDLQKGSLDLLSRISSAGIDDYKFSKNVKRSVTAVNALATCLAKATDKSKKNSNSVGLAIVGALVNTVFIIESILIYLIVDIFCIIFISWMWYEMSKHMSVDWSARNEKANDRKANRNNEFLLERWADEFVARSGYGEYLISALNKLYRMCEWGAINPVASNILSESTIWISLVGAASWINDKICMLFYFDPVIYEDNYNRAYRVLQDMRGVFKEAKLPSDMADEWLNKIRNTEAEVKKAKTLSNTPVGKALWNILNNVTNPAVWVNMLYDGKLERDCSVLEDRIDDMQNNKLYQLSYAFQRM